MSARSEAVLPAYLIGLVTAGAFAEDRTLLRRMQSLAFEMKLLWTVRVFRSARTTTAERYGLPR